MVYCRAFSWKIKDGKSLSDSVRNPQRRPSAICSHREPTDDFFCLRYGVWYASLDCAIRSRYRTCDGCLDCEQGRFNLKRHAAGLGRFRNPYSRPVRR